MTDALRFRRNDADVIFERFDNEIVAIQLATGAYYSLPGVAGDVFLLLASEPTISELAVALVEKYEASAGEIEQDLAPFLKEMEGETLIISQTGTAGPLNPLSLAHSGPRLVYAPPALQPYTDLQELFLVDPVHDAGPAGWPQPKPDSAPAGECRYRMRSPASVIFERFDEETIAMNLGTGGYYSFFGPAEDIFLILEQEPTLPEVVRALRTKYVAPEADVSGPTLKFLNSLVVVGLAEQEGLEADSQTPIRQLTLAKSGSGFPFTIPSLESFHDQPGMAPTLDELQDRSALEYSRKRYRLQEQGLLFRKAGSDTTIINMERGEYFLLNPSASAVWRILEQKPTATELLSGLSGIYEGDRRDLTAAALLLLQNLRREGMVAVEASEGSSNLPDVSPAAQREKFEPFSVQAFRDLRSLFLPFPSAKGDPSAPVSDARDLVSTLSRYHEEASSRAGLSEATYRMAGQNLRVRCAGGINASDLGLALSHLKTELPSDAPADFTIQVWDAVSGGPSSHPFLSNYLADLFLRWDVSCGPRGEVLAFHCKEIPVLYHAGPDILSVVDNANRTAYFLKRDNSPFPYWEIGSPFRAILHCWLAGLGIQFVHGAAVGNAEGGVLLAGKGGSGKSTTAVACLNAGMLYAGDDYCSVQLGEVPYLHSLYNTAKLKGRADLERFPYLKDRVWNPGCFDNPDFEKATFFLSQTWPDLVNAGFPLRAVFVPQITGERDSRLGDCQIGTALLAVAASTIAQLPMAGAEDLDRLGQLVERLPLYTLYLGTDLAQVPSLIQSVL